MNSIPIIETLIGLAMIGVAGVIHHRHRRHRHRRHHSTGGLPRPGPPFRVRWLPVPLATLGLTLIVYTWTLNIGSSIQPADTLSDDLAAPLPAANSDGAARHGVLLVRGTPTDDDSASDESARSYSLRLGALVAEALARPPAAIALVTEPLDAEQWKALRTDPANARQWCRDSPRTEFVAAVAIPALRLPDGVGYAPWREPEELLVACGSEAKTTQRGRVNERLGDRVPYEQALTEELRAALAKLGTSGTR